MSSNREGLLQKKNHVHKYEGNSYKSDFKMLEQCLLFQNISLKCVAVKAMSFTSIYLEAAKKLVTW